MQHSLVKTHRDGIWISAQRELDLVRECDQALRNQGWQPLSVTEKNYGYPYMYARDHQTLHCRFVDSVFLEQSDALEHCDVIITDNVAIKPVAGQVLLPLPEFWSIWQFDPEYVDREPTAVYNCFMHRGRGDRNMFFYELIRRNLLQQGLVSYNCSIDDYEKIYQSIDRQDYANEHELGRALIPYNTVEAQGTLEQCIIDSRISLIIETYTSDSHIVFSEKIFRALQLPRPWLMYCSPGAVACLRSYGFDVMDDVVDHSYDNIAIHGRRMTAVLDQLHAFANRNYSPADYERFAQACDHNQQLIKSWQQTWPARFDQLLQEIQQL